jgi:hypothetical protein
MYQTAARHTRNFLTPKRQPVSSVLYMIASSFIVNCVTANSIHFSQNEAFLCRRSLLM